jgi:hypothetical protein
MMSPTRVRRYFPRLPPGWSSAKSSARNPRGSELERTGFFFDMGIENDVAELCEGGTGSAGDGNDESGPFFDVGKKGDHFGRLT